MFHALTVDRLLTERLTPIKGLRRRLQQRGVRPIVSDLVVKNGGASPMDLVFAVVAEILSAGADLSLDTVLRHSDVAALCEAIAPAGHREDEVATVQQILEQVILAWHLSTQVREGNQVYEVAPGLAAMLRFTELRGLTCDDLRLPFSAIALVVPKSAELWIADAGRLRIPVAEIYAVEDEVPGRRWRLLVVAGEENGRSVMERLMIPLREGGSIEEAVATASERLGSTAEPDLFEEWKTHFRWLMNAVLYASNAGAREEVWRNKAATRLRDRIAKLPPGKKRERLKSELRFLNPDRRIVLGPGIHLPPLLLGVGDGQISNQHVETRVQGHWKRQPHGPRAVERKVIWIQPYWRVGAAEATEQSSRPTRLLV